MVFTEMASSEGIIRHQPKTCDVIKFQEDERPIGIQIFGSKPETMLKAAQVVSSDFKPDLLDINFGCPVRKVVNKNGGAAVLKDLVLTEELVRATVEGAGETPVSIKIRTGWDDNNSVFIQAGEIAERSGAKMVTLHARSRSKMFRGKADWTAIAELKKAVGITIIGNGDVFTPENARQVLDMTDCDGVMVGRAGMGNPMIYGQMHHFVEHGETAPDPTMIDRIAMARYHTRLLIEEYGEMRGGRMARKYLGWYVKGFRGASALRPKLFQVSCMADVDAVFSEYLGGQGETLPEMSV